MTWVEPISQMNGIVIARLRQLLCQGIRDATRQRSSTAHHDGVPGSRQEQEPEMVRLHSKVTD